MKVVKCVQYKISGLSLVNILYRIKSSVSDIFESYLIHDSDIDYIFQVWSDACRIFSDYLKNEIPRVFMILEVEIEKQESEAGGKNQTEF